MSLSIWKNFKIYSILLFPKNLTDLATSAKLNPVTHPRGTLFQVRWWTSAVLLLKLRRKSCLKLWLLEKVMEKVVFKLKRAWVTTCTLKLCRTGIPLFTQTPLIMSPSFRLHLTGILEMGFLCWDAKKNILFSHFCSLQWEKWSCFRSFLSC